MAINLKITYRISDLYTYLTRYSSPEDVLNAKGYEVVMGETIHTDINTIISEDRSQLSHRIEEQLKEYAREAELGLEVMSVTLALSLIHIFSDAATDAGIPITMLYTIADAVTPLQEIFGA